jgi:hypothetical protein
MQFTWFDATTQIARWHPTTPVLIAHRQHQRSANQAEPSELGFGDPCDPEPLQGGRGKAIAAENP